MAEQAGTQQTVRRQALPDERGFFGEYGGQFLPPQLEVPFAEITKAYHEIENDAAFIAELRYLRKHFQGRPTPVYHARTLSLANGGAQIYLKREDLNHTGAHKLNHCMGEAPAGQVHGQEEGHRRDRRRPARRRAGHGRRPLRPRVRDPHGRGRHRQAGAQRQPHAAPGRHGRARLARPQDAQGGRRLGLRGVSGRLRELHLLHRLRGRAASLPAHGARLPARRGHRSSRAVPGDDRQPPRRGGGVRRRRLQRDRHLHGLPRRPLRADRRRAAGARRRASASTPRP